MAAMQVAQDHELVATLEEFDSRSTPFEAWELGSRLGGLAARLYDEGTPKSNVLAAEMVIWHPDVVDWNERAKRMQVEVGQEMIDYWSRRCAESSHPLLRMRYAEAAWHFGTKAKRGRAKGDILKAMIDAVLKAAKADLFTREMTGYENLETALELGMQGKNSALVGQVRDELISYENRHAVDHHPGTWGHCFRLLLLSVERRKPVVSDEQEAKIIADMEERLSRLSNRDSVEELNPHHVQDAALLLARYYRKKDSQGENLQRVMVVYTTAFVRKAETNRWVGSAWLEDVYRKLIAFGLPDEAKAFQACYRESARAMMEEMPSHRVSVPIDVAELNRFIEHMTSGSWEEVFGKFREQFLPHYEQQLEMIRAAMKGRFIFDLFPLVLKDHEGRTIARLGTFDQDPEGHLVHHYANVIQWNAPMLRTIVEEWCAERNLTANDITAFVYQSPICDPTKRPIIEAALRAYVAKDWIIAIHLLVPQIESTVRRFLDMSGRPTIRTPKPDDSGLLLKTLDDLLKDEEFERVFEADVAFYLRSLLTDQRGWNVRNDVSHGITPIGGFNAMIADRLLHVLLILGSVRGKKAEQDAETASTPADVADTSVPDLNPAQD